MMSFLPAGAESVLLAGVTCFLPAGADFFATTDFLAAVGCLVAISGLCVKSRRKAGPSERKIIRTKSGLGKRVFAARARNNALMRPKRRLTHALVAAARQTFDEALQLELEEQTGGEIDADLRACA